VKAFLMHRDRDFDLQGEPPPNEGALTQDLELNTLFGAMALGDEFLFDVARRSVLSGLNDPESIRYRQEVLADCIEHPSIVREIYDVAVEGVLAEKKISLFLFVMRGSPGTILSRSVQLMGLYVGVLKRLRAIADEHAGEFRSEGFTRFFAMLVRELDAEYFREIERHLEELKLRRGVLISAELGRGNKGIRHVLRSPRERARRWGIFPPAPSGYSFEIAERDESGFRALGRLRERGINLVANALGQSVDHVRGFFAMLRGELAFYVGCVNLAEQLARKGEPACMPVPFAPGEARLSARGLYDVCLSFHIELRVVGNDLDADGKSLVMVTGANQGGKSTFLRSLGLAQLMMQCGMFVGASSFSADVCSGVFTHYKREEDATMRSGKLDEELGRMSEIADTITSNCLLLCNESFASTNEREGSEIARQVIRAMLEAGVRVFVVTHLYDLAQGFFRHRMENALFLRAERRADGGRTFRLLEGEPLPTSHGRDLYERIFGMTGLVVTTARSDPAS